MKMKTARIQQAIEEAWKNNNLLCCLTSLTTRAKRVDIPSLVIDLNNSGRISVCSPVVVDELAELEQHKFWDVFMFFEELIPRLICDTEQLITLISALIEKAGTDGFSGKPREWLSKWCNQNQTGATEIIEKAKNGNQNCLNFCVWALHGLGDITKSLELIENKTPELRAIGIRSLELMPNLSVEIAKELIDWSFKNAHNDLSDETVIPTINLAFSIWARVNMLDFYRQHEFIQFILNSHGEKIADCLTVNIYNYNKGMSSKTLSMALHALCGKLANPQVTLSYIDGLLHKSDERWKPDDVYHFFSSVLKKIECNFGELKTNGFNRYVFRNPKHQSKLFTAWLADGDHKLCKFLAEMISKLGVKNLELTILKEDIPRSKEDQIFMMRKCVGFLFVHSVSVASILLSVVKHGNKDAREDAEYLLFDPMLLSYSGELRNFLESKKNDKSKRVSGCIARLLKKHNDYLKKVKKAGSIKELLPSIEQRRAVALKHRELNMDIQKKARESSPLLKLIRKQILLYGRKSFSIVTKNDGKRIPSINPLTQYSYETEIPRLLVIDQVGLDIELAHFRAEKRSSR